MTVAIQSSLTIAGACVDPAGKDLPSNDKAREYVRLTRSGLVRGYRVEQQVHHADGRVTFSTYHQLVNEPPAEAKDIVIHSGPGRDHMEALRWHTFTGRNRYDLNNEQGELLRVLNSEGRLMDERYFAPYSCDVLPPAPTATKPVPVGAAVAAFGSES